MRAPPGNIEILLPVWGERYIGDFLGYGLPSLLAPGNLPALSRLAPCTFVLLAPARDAAVIQSNELWARLRDCCSVRVVPIDDLISRASSTVLTLAYALAIRETRERALDTCFVPLVADYVISDGSLLAVVKHVFAGASGVLAGNFQISREVALPRLEAERGDNGVLAIAPKSLVEISFNALHRKTLGEIVGEGGGIGPETNRLFWRVDPHCMVGRFYLMHMIAIHPEVLDFTIASPSDYSLIPELCPSGEIVRMTDSDDYFVVECQPQEDGAQASAGERIESALFAKALAFWATAMHRENAYHAVIFHSRALPPRLADVLVASDAFVSEVEANSSRAALPFRDHPVWRRALDHHMATAERSQDLGRLAAITADASLVNRRGLASRLRAILLGRAPYFRPWHPRWPDVRMLKQSLVAARGDVAFVSDAPARARGWLDAAALARGVRSTMHFRPADIRDRTTYRLERHSVQFDSLFVISDQVPAKFAEALPRLVSLMKPDGVIVLGIGQFFFETEGEPSPVCPPGEGAFTGGGLPLQEINRVTAGKWRLAVQDRMMRHARNSIRRADLTSVYELAFAGGLAAVSMFLNIISVSRRRSSQPRVSSLFYMSNSLTPS
jgi:hypothetical protein